MEFSLDRNYDPRYNAGMLTEIENDMETIEKALNSLLYKINTHTHTAEQIKFGNSNVLDQINDTNRRINNLILESGGDSNLEVVDARGEFKVLGDRLNQFDSRFIDVRKGFEEIKERFKELPSVDVVKDLGADPTGAEDSSEIIQRALNMAKGTDGLEIYVKPGTYRLDNVLVNWGNTKFSARGAYFKSYHGQYMMVNGDSSVEYEKHNGNGNILIEGGIWDCNGLNIDRGINGFSFGHGSNIWVVDAVVKDVRSYHGIEFNACWKSGAINCRFLGFYDPDGTRSFSEAIQLDLAQRSGVFGAFGKWDFTTCSNMLIENCYFGSSGTPGTQPWPRGVGSHSSTIGYHHENITVKGNTFEGTTGWGVRCYNWNNSNIIDNTFLSCAYGLNVNCINANNPVHTMNDKFEQLSKSQEMKNIIVARNKFYNTTSSKAIYFKGFHDKEGIIRNVNVFGNIIDTVNGDNQCGIRMDAVRNGIVAMNVILETSGDGILYNDCIGILTTFNHISSVKRDGIAAFGSCSDMVTSSNLIRHPARYGIEQSHVYFAMVNGNFITGAGNKENGAYEAIRIANGSKRVSVYGNVCRSVSSLKNLARGGIYITHSARQIVRFGNDCRGSWTVGGVVDNSDGSKTDAKDVF